MSLNLDLFCCQNPKCSLFGIRDTGKITVTYKYGKKKINLCYDARNVRIGFVKQKVL